MHNSPDNDTQKIIANPNGKSISSVDVRLELILQRDKTVYVAARIGSRKPNLLRNFMLHFLFIKVIKTYSFGNFTGASQIKAPITQPPNNEKTIE